MIVGLGMDIVAIARIRRAHEQFGDRFLARIFTGGEREYAGGKRDPVPALAARFAAKEAALKALGTGAARGVRFRDVEVVRAEGEAPRILFHGAARHRFESLAALSASLTLTHDAGLASAVVVLEGE